MQSKILETPVDSMVEFVKKNPNCTVSSITRQLKIPLEIIEKWLIVLEEYGVLQVTYRGFEGYVSVTSKELKKEKEESNIVDVDSLKEIFIDKSRKKKLSYDKMKEVWPIFISEYEKEIKVLFEDKAKSSGFESTKISLAWAKYRKELQIL